MEDLLTTLVGNGRGQYQADDIERTLARGRQTYPNMSGFKWPLFADVGTGKTPASLVYLYYVREYLRSQGDPRCNKPVLYITPATVKWNWVSEGRDWRTDLDQTDIWIIDGPPDQRERQLQFMQLLPVKMVITNYETIAIHQQLFQELGTYEDPFFLAIVCDEVHYIKWKTSQRARAVRSIAADFHIGLTGTPISNKPDSLHGILEWLDNTPMYRRTLPAVPPRPKKNCPLGEYLRKKYENISQGCRACAQWVNEDCTHPRRDRKPYTNPRESMEIEYRSRGQWGDFDTFRARYCEIETLTIHLKGGRTKEVTKVIGPKKSAMEELHRRLEDFGMTRWRRADVLPLEPIAYEHVRLRATPQQADIYNQLRAKYVTLIDENDRYVGRKDIMSVLAQLTYFRRATTLTPREFQLALQGKPVEFAPDLNIRVSDDGAKQEWLFEFMETILEEDGNGDKFLIFCDWTSALRPLLKRIDKQGYKTLHWNGSRLVERGSGEKGTCAIIEGATDKKARQAISERWNADPNFKILLGSPAAYEGINLQGGLTKEDTMYVVMMNMPWLPAAVIQAIGRAQRFGQLGQVVALFPSIIGTIDEMMTKALLSKQHAFDLSIDGGDQQMADLFKLETGRQVLDLVGEGIR